MRSDHLSKHMKIHEKPGNIITNGGVPKLELANGEDTNTSAYSDGFTGAEEYESDEESGSDISDSEIASSGLANSATTNATTLSSQNGIVSAPSVITSAAPQTEVQS